MLLVSSPIWTCREHPQRRRKPAEFMSRVAAPEPVSADGCSLLRARCAKSVHPWGRHQKGSRSSSRAAPQERRSFELQRRRVNASFPSNGSRCATRAILASRGARSARTPVLRERTLSPASGRGRPNFRQLIWAAGNCVGDERRERWPGGQSQRGRLYLRGPAETIAPGAIEFRVFRRSFPQINARRTPAG